MAPKKEYMRSRDHLPNAEEMRRVMDLEGEDRFLYLQKCYKTDEKAWGSQREGIKYNLEKTDTKVTSHVSDFMAFCEETMGMQLTYDEYCERMISRMNAFISAEPKLWKGPLETTRVAAVMSALSLLGVKATEHEFIGSNEGKKVVMEVKKDFSRPVISVMGDGEGFIQPADAFYFDYVDVSYEDLLEDTVNAQYFHAPGFYLNGMYSPDRDLVSINTGISETKQQDIKLEECLHRYAQRKWPSHKMEGLYCARELQKLAKGGVISGQPGLFNETNVARHVHEAYVHLIMLKRAYDLDHAENTEEPMHTWKYDRFGNALKTMMAHSQKSSTERSAQEGSSINTMKDCYGLAVDLSVSIVDGDAFEGDTSQERIDSSREQARKNGVRKLANNVDGENMSEQRMQKVYAAHDRLTTYIDYLRNILDKNEIAIPETPASFDMTSNAAQEGADAAFNVGG